MVMVEALLKKSSSRTMINFSFLSPFEKLTLRNTPSLKESIIALRPIKVLLGTGSCCLPLSLVPKTINWSTPSLFSNICLLGFFILSMYALNNYLNFQADLKNPKFNYPNRITKYYFLTIFIISYIVSVLFAYAIGITLLIIITVSTLIWTLYGHPKWSLKIHPIIGGFLHFSAILCHQLLAWKLWSTLSNEALIFSIIFALFATAGYYFGLIEDYKYENSPQITSKANLSLFSSITFCLAYISLFLIEYHLYSHTLTQVIIIIAPLIQLSYLAKLSQKAKNTQPNSFLSQYRAAYYGIFLCILVLITKQHWLG